MATRKRVVHAIPAGEEPPTPQPTTTLHTCDNCGRGTPTGYEKRYIGCLLGGGQLDENDRDEYAKVQERDAEVMCLRQNRKYWRAKTQ